MVVPLARRARNANVDRARVAPSWIITSFPHRLVPLSPRLSPTTDDNEAVVLVGEHFSAAPSIKPSPIND
jgi:hypothetical protein